MRFIVDECTGPTIAAWLRDLGHDVYSVYDEARGAKDDVVLSKAVADERILITADKDFGEKVFRDKLPHKGIVLLRLEDQRKHNQKAALEKLLNNHADQLAGRFVVVTETQIRFAKGQHA